jgi:hypothetical protein
VQTNGLVINRLAFDKAERRYPTQQSQQQQTSSESCSSSNGNTSKNNYSDDSLDSDIPDAMDDLQLLDDDGEDEETESQDQNLFVDNAGSDVPKEWTRWAAGTNYSQMYRRPFLLRRITRTPATPLL